MPPIQYLTTSYYEHWLAGLETLLKELGYSTEQELAGGRVTHVKQTPHPPPSAEMAEGLVRGGMPATREQGRLAPAFKIGDTVRARNLAIDGHTRLGPIRQRQRGRDPRAPRLARLPDTAAHDRGENPQPLYTVRFEAKELWGDNLERRDCVYIDLWEDYLGPVSKG